MTYLYVYICLYLFIVQCTLYTLWYCIVWIKVNIDITYFQIEKLLSDIPRCPKDPTKGYKDIEIIILPTKHCFFNPIELIWAWVKGDVARKNTGKGKGLDMAYTLTKQAIENVCLSV